MSYRIFTIESGSVADGARVEKLTLKGVDVEIPAILIGEEGRGRSRGVLPVQLTADQQQEWEEKGSVVIHAAELGSTRQGKPKLLATHTASSSEKVVCVLRTGIGFRGGNNHTGDRTDVPCPMRGQQMSATYICKCKVKRPEEITGDCWVEWTHPEEEGTIPQFAEFPGEIIAQGEIAQGDAGRMGSGKQLVAVLPAGVVFRTSYSGRLYGSPSSHYYCFDGQKIVSATWDERVAADLF